MGPLQGLRFIEIEGIGPGPFCGMMLADMGADVIVVRRKGGGVGGSMVVTERGKRSLVLDLKSPEDVERVLKLCEQSDGLFEGFRPGVMERLGLGPEVCLARNRRLAYGRITGFGQTGPYSRLAGHDLNFLAVSGVLDMLRGQDGKPEIPLNLVADYGGGAMHMAFGLLCAVISARRDGRGQVIDLSISEAAASLASVFYSVGAAEDFGSLLNSSAPFYRVYDCQDGKEFSIASMEPQFFQKFLSVLKLENDEEFHEQWNRAKWPQMVAKLEKIFKTASQQEWIRRFSGSDCCAFPVNTVAKIQEDAHVKSRQSFVEIKSYVSPAPPLRFSWTPANINTTISEPDEERSDLFDEFDL